MIYVCVILFLILSATVLLEWPERKDFVQMPRCPACHYDLTGLPKRGVCPECGVAYTETIEKATARTAAHDVRVRTWCWIVAGDMLAIAVLLSAYVLVSAPQMMDYFGWYVRGAPAGVTGLRRDSWVHLSWIPILFITFSPLFALIRRRWLAMAMFAASLVGSLVLWMAMWGIVILTH